LDLQRADTDRKRAANERVIVLRSHARSMTGEFDRLALAGRVVACVKSERAVANEDGKLARAP
jgi:hypothetical protein